MSALPPLLSAAALALRLALPNQACTPDSTTPSSLTAGAELRTRIHSPGRAEPGKSISFPVHRRLLAPDVLFRLAGVAAGCLGLAWLPMLRTAGRLERQGLGFAWGYTWLPGLPILLVFLGVYVEALLGQTTQELANLRRLTYRFKKL
jgi:hypothetical protein